MRKIDSIIIHCSATKVGQDFTAKDIDRWHLERGFNGIGYHYVIRLNGQIEKGRDISLSGAHCKGWNERSIGICYIGGLDASGRPADTRTTAQKRELYQLILDLQREYDILQVLGHRDTSPDLNGDGVVEPYEYVKACPCFSVKEFMKSGRELLFVLWGAMFFSVFFSGCRNGKEIVQKSSQVKVDSSSLVNLGRVSVEQSLTSEKESGTIDEHIEQTIFLFPFPADTVHAKMMIKTIVDRNLKKERMSYDNRSLERMDSLSKSSEVRIKNDVNEKCVEFPNQGKRWWKVTLLLLGILGYFVYRCVKKKRI